MGYGPGGMRGPAELVDVQGSPPPSSRKIHPNKLEIKQRWQKACTGEEGAPN